MPEVDDYEAFWEDSLGRLEAELNRTAGELTQSDRERVWRDFERRATRAEDEETLAPDPVDDGPAGALPTVGPQEERAARPVDGARRSDGRE